MVSTSPPLPMSSMFSRRCRRILRTIRRSSRTGCDPPRGAGQRPHTRERPQAPTTLQPLDPQSNIRRGCPISLSKSHTKSYREVLSDVSDLFRVPPSGVESSFLLKYRDHEDDFCTLTDVTFSDALPVFATDHTIHLTAAATGQQVQLMSTCPRDPLAASVASTSPRYWSRVLQTRLFTVTPWLVAKPVPSINGALTTWPILPLPMPGRSFSICAVTTRPGAFMRFVLHNQQEIRHSRSHPPHFSCGLPSPSTSSANPPSPNSSKPSAGYLARR